MSQIQDSDGAQEYIDQKDTIGYSDEAEEKNSPPDNDSNDDDDDTGSSSIDEGKEKLNEMQRDGTIQTAKDLCSMDMTDTIDMINQFVFKVRNGYSLNLSSHYQFIIDRLRNKYLKHLEKNDTRYDELLQNEKKYFREKYSKKMYDDLLNYREIYLVSSDKKNENEVRQMMKNLEKTIVVNEKYKQQEIIIEKEIIHYQKEKDKIKETISSYSNSKDVESTKLYNKNIELLKQVGLYVYVIYFLYLCVFISILLITDLKNTITSFYKILFLITIIILPDFIYPNFYFYILVPFVDFVYNNTFFTKELPPNVYNDISENKF
tara:strand:+ start:981 stop:1940 length:960 start_codon:yes stop_codon:yes gene_type:complete